MTKRVFPKEIMVKWEDAGNDEPFMSVGVDANEMSEGAGGGPIDIGVYKLVRKAKIVTSAEVVRGR